ncbi:DNRLRE domain-containing protein [Corallococcus sp. ZKHCc1 1396]|uniref:DNRLRE domain-containing protein n=1 Tax=Corallococcus soli TaxID=2710757 RepID=A0ABR9PZ62_9BACT|nr:DNRLRE domain-containing protein [Corallococcus soli]MBE4753228.1 DNRLRE domain-containing protein [Corallococcus soli]
MLPALGLMVACGGGDGLEATEDAPALRSTKAAAVTEQCQPRTVYTEDHLSATYDTYVEQASPDASHGTSVMLVSDGSPRQETYLDFRFSGFDGFIQARLRLFASDGSTNGPALYKTQSGWTDTLTWNTRPAPVGTALGNVGEVASGSWVEYDVSSVVKGSGAHAFVLVPEGGNGMDFVSNEDPRRELRPVLVLTHAHTVCTYQGSGGGLTQAVLRGGGGDEVVQALATTSNGGHVVAGVYTGAGSLGGATFPSQGGLMLGRFHPDGTHEWSRAFPQASATLTVTSVTLTPLGNVLVVGGYAGTPDFGQGPLPTSPYYGTFIAKFSPVGQLTWAKGFTAGLVTGDGYDPLPIRANAVATDANGSLIFTGYFFGRANLGGGELYAGPGGGAFDDAVPGMFIAKYSWEGVHLWSRAYEGGLWGAQGEGLATDSAGNVLLAGYASRNADGSPVLGATHRENPLVAKFSPAGTLLWSRALNGAQGRMVGVAALPGDAVAFAGNFTRRFTFAGQTLESTQADEWDGGNADVMLGALEASGTDRWARKHGADAAESVSKVAVDAQGRFKLAGISGGAVDLGGGLIGPTRGNDPQSFVASYGPDGAHQWSRIVGTNHSDPLVAVTPDGTTLFGGTLRGITHVGPTPFGPSRGADLLLLKLAP